jgi:asparagine synthase (glutamine-hydrolysing)
MCGIAGYWGEGNREVLERMADSLAHRGPDASGYFERDMVNLAHRRLSIVDLSPTGAQPMSNRDGTLTVVFNGEIYNHHELRTQFLSSYAFRGTSDTEVLLALYEKFGTDSFTHLRGMFAFALYDAGRGTLFLVRDHLGKKPLYYSRVGETLLFGSELKALRAHPLCPHTLSMDALTQYLVHEYVPGNTSIYEGVTKLAAGSYLTYNGSSLSVHPYYTPPTTLGTYKGTLEEAEVELESLLTKAVAERLVADVPVGVFLSGGLDSSTIAYLAQAGTTERVRTFSIGFEDAHFDESGYAKEVAAALKTEHHERTVTEDDLIAVIEKLPRVLDEPMADASIIPTYLLSEFARSHVTVALGGDGADEFFWGYDTFFAHRIAHALEAVPQPFLKVIGKGVNALPVSHRYMSLDFKLKKFMSGIGVGERLRNTYWLGAFTPTELSRIATFPVEDSSIFVDTRRRYEGKDFWSALQDEYREGYLTEDIMVKADRASMAASLEVRSPFLDPRVVHFALSLPASMKLRGMTGKYVLRKLMETRLPAHVTERKKHGFNMPIGAWFRGPLRSYVTDMLLGGSLIESGLFKQSELAILLESHASGTHDHRKKLWSLLVLELWMQKWYSIW